MSKIGWIVAGSVAAVTTLAVSVKMAVEYEDPAPRRKPVKRESQIQRTKRMQAQLRNNKYHDTRPKWRYER